MSKKTLIIGASLKAYRYSNLAIHKLLSKEHSVVAIGLREGQIAGVDIIKQKKNFKDIDTVTLYIRPQHQLEYYDYIISLKPKRVIFNPGTENPEFYKLLIEHKIIAEVSCTLVLLSTNQY
ncbi:CoA-binding protein [Flavobacteriaceae bacterium AU392]|nr:CoA-binding protein [Flavobacteriaceae bacterium]RKM81110.1 CoA-binding protein [Flavobacteriaceae bacterium AU392]